MKLKLAILGFVVLLTIIIVPGGYSFWDEKLSIQGTILIDTPEEVLTGPAILDGSMLENTELQFEPAISDTDVDLSGEMTNETGNESEATPPENTGDSTPAYNNDEETSTDNTDDGTSTDNTDDGTPADNTDDGTPADNTDDGTPAENTDEETSAEDSGDRTPTESNGKNAESNSAE